MPKEPPPDSRKGTKWDTPLETPGLSGDVAICRANRVAYCVQRTIYDN